MALPFRVAAGLRGIFSIRHDPTLTGAEPNGGLIRLGDRKLVGTTQAGGGQDAGVIYTINP